MNWSSRWTTLQNFVSTNGHGDQLSYKCRGQIRNLDILCHSFVSFHVKALNVVNSIDFGYELKSTECFIEEKKLKTLTMG